MDSNGVAPTRPGQAMLGGEGLEVELRVTGDAARADGWVLVLSSLALPHRLVREGQAWRVMVPVGAEAEAEEALGRDELERRSSEPAEAPSWGPSLLGVVVGLGLAALFYLSGSRDDGSRWFQRGAAVAELVVGAEPWRAVTALTLHADLAHLLGNVVFGLVMVTAVAERLGPGLAAALILLVGALGNLGTALAYGSGHASVGASTSLFGALGLMGALRVFGERQGATRRPRHRLMVVAACLALLGMLGVGERADVIAHALGFAWGALLGSAVGRWLRRPPGPLVQALLGLLAVAALVGAWMQALG